MANRFKCRYSIRLRLLAGFAFMIGLQVSASIAVWQANNNADTAAAAVAEAEADATAVTRTTARLAELQISLSEFLRTQTVGDKDHVQQALTVLNATIALALGTGSGSDALSKLTMDLNLELAKLIEAETAQREAVGKLTALSKQTQNAVIALTAAGARIADLDTAVATAAAAAASLRPLAALDRYLATSSREEEANFQSGLQDLYAALMAVDHSSSASQQLKRHAQTSRLHATHLNDMLPVLKTATSACAVELSRLGTIGEEISFLLRKHGLEIAESQRERHLAMSEARYRVRLTLACIAVVSCLLGTIIAVSLGLSITRPLSRVANAMRFIADGALDTDVPECDRRDEVGIIARALQVFKQSMSLNVHLVASKNELINANAELAELARVDGLTGLANRRGFDEAIEREFKRCVREELPLSLILIDVDHFKLFNDTYGHQAGDACLRDLGSVLRDAVQRADDLVARYGGEEFAIILPHTPNDAAVIIAERVRQSIRDRGMTHEHCSSGVVTASLGVATGYPVKAGETTSDILARADAMLYRAKVKGRDRVERSYAEICVTP